MYLRLQNNIKNVYSHSWFGFLFACSFIMSVKIFLFICMAYGVMAYYHHFKDKETEDYIVQVN